jgi:uncharacterized damage-inducible protein DinB
MTEKILARLFEHNNWANLQIIQACTALRDEQLDAQPAGATYGSIRATLLHLVDAQRGYLAFLTQPIEIRRQDRPPLKYAELRDSASASGKGLLALAQNETDQVPQARLETRDGFWVEPWVVLVQVINHATEHREQIKSMLSALGVTPPEIDSWMYGEAVRALVPIEEPKP